MAKAPIPLRLSDEDERALESIPGNRSDILRRGIHLQAAEWSPLVPLYANDVDEPAIQDAIEEAASRCIERLDELFPGTPKERGGIGSNFQGLLMEHLAAMLTGREASKKSYARELNPLFGDWKTFGRPVSAGANEGITLLKIPDRLDGEQLFYDDDVKTFVPLSILHVGALYTSSEHAAKAGFDWLRKEGLSPRECQLRLCVLSFEKDGPPVVSSIGPTQFV